MKNEQGLRNIVVLRNLPSNLIEEAIIILKDSIIQDANNVKRNENILDEANYIVSEYINSEKNKNKTNKRFENKYKKLRKINVFLILGVFLSIVIGLWF